MPKTAPFDHYGDRYDAWFERHHAVYHAELETVRRLIPPSAVGGLEVGVGSGKFAVPLGIATGVEPSAVMARKAAQQGVRVLRAVAEHLPFTDACFDHVLMVTAVCFFDDVLQAFKEAYRVLKPGGCVIVGFVDRDSGLGRQYAERRAESLFYKDAIFYSAPEVLSFLAVTGFAHELCKQTLIPGGSPAMVEDGFGRGGFVAARGLRP
jgi:SAM-dependent methyltransferase